MFENFSYNFTHKMLVNKQRLSIERSERDRALGAKLKCTVLYKGKKEQSENEEWDGKQRQTVNIVIQLVCSV